VGGGAHRPGRRAFGIGLAAFVAASAGCGLAPDLGALIVARFVQGSAAAVMMPSSMALLGQAYPDRTKRARAVAVWAMGGAVASSAGPVLGGLLTLASWRSIFFVNVPVGAVALLLVARPDSPPRRRVPFDWIGQFTAVTSMGALTYGAIEAGSVRHLRLRIGSLVPPVDLVPSLLAASDVLGTGWFGAVAAEAGPGKTVAVVGDGAVGLLGVLAARQLGAERIIAMSRHESRQKLALEFGATDIVTEPVRRFLPELVDHIWSREIDPGKVFDLTLPLAEVAEGYRAMDERRAIKTLLLP
jgi:MFS family permease